MFFTWKILLRLTIVTANGGLDVIDIHVVSCLDSHVADLSFYGQPLFKVSDFTDIMEK